MFRGAICLLEGFVALATKLATPEGIVGKV